MIARFFRAGIAALAIVTALSPLSAVHAESEATSSIQFWGQLIELSSTDVPTTIVVRTDPTGSWTDYTVDIDEDTAFGTGSANTTAMTDWITGDWLRVTGTLNANTGVVTAGTIVNTSIDPANHSGLNGWITAIGDDSMTVQWNGVEHEVNVTSDTRMVVPPVNPAALSDFQIGDRVRVRMERGTDDARIIVALRRGDHIYLMARTRGFSAELTDIDEADDASGSLTVTLLANPHLRGGDVNNLVGVEGDELTVTYDEHTNFVRKYNGSASVEEFQEGDKLFVVGRVNDDGTVSARLVKDESIWKKDVARHVGRVASVDTSTNTIELTAVDDSSADTATVTYGDDTEFTRGGESVDESEVEVGDLVRVRGTARRTSSTDGLTIVDVDSIVIVPERASDDEDTTSDDESSDEEETLADLTVSEISLDGSTLVVTVENVGDADVDGTTTVYVWLDDELTWTYSSSTLADQDFLDAGGSSDVSPQTIDEETEVKACVDYGDDVDESDEDNNCMTVTLGA